jgi:hypothetical protein
MPFDLCGSRGLLSSDGRFPISITRAVFSRARKLGCFCGSSMYGKLKRTTRLPLFTITMQIGQARDFRRPSPEARPRAQADGCARCAAVVAKSDLPCGYSVNRSISTSPMVWLIHFAELASSVRKKILVAGCREHRFRLAVRTTPQAGCALANPAPRDFLLSGFR